MRKIVLSEKGSTLIIVVFALTAILIIMSLVADYGMAYLRSSQYQNAIDAAVLAGARFLPCDKDDSDALSLIKDTIKEYLGKNGVDSISDDLILFSGLVDDKYTQIDVSAPVNVAMNFARIINVDDIVITKTASAKVSPSARVNDAVPLSIKKENLENCIAINQLNHITLKYGAKSDESNQGAFGALDLDGVKKGGANDYENWLAYGYTQELSIGENLIPVEPGNMAGPTSTAFLYRYSRCSHFQGDGGCTAEHFEPSCPRVIKVPVVEYVSSHYVKIIGFAAFVLENSPEKDTIVGSFVKMVVPGSSFDETGTLTAPDYGVYNVKLVK